MPNVHESSPNAEDRAAYLAALAETCAHGQEMLQRVRDSRERHHLTAESLTVERRILREDFDDRNHENA